jgi:hypothetical protein
LEHGSQVGVRREPLATVGTRVDRRCRERGHGEVGLVELSWVATEHV